MDWREPGHDSVNYIQGTKGARASEYYSMAKLMPLRKQRDEYLRLAEEDIDDALSSIQDDPSGYLAIRGHIHLARDRLDEALADFEQVRESRQENGDVRAISEANADIALVHIRLGNNKDAIKLLRGSVAILEGAKSVTFALRARKRLAVALLKLVHPFQAWRQINTAYETAVKNQIYDQITPTMEIANWLAERLGLRTR